MASPQGFTVRKATATEHSKSEKFLLSSSERKFHACEVLFEYIVNTTAARAYEKVRLFSTPAQKKRGSSVLVCILHFTIITLVYTMEAK
jgi:hypothetical protein